MSKTTEIVVKNCESCPFYERGIISALADVLAKDGRKTGTCKNVSTWPHLGFFSMKHVPDPKVPPDFCPLRDGDTIIKLGR